MDGSPAGLIAEKSEVDRTFRTGAVRNHEPRVPSLNVSRSRGTYYPEPAPFSIHLAASVSAGVIIAKGATYLIMLSLISAFNGVIS